MGMILRSPLIGFNFLSELFEKLFEFVEEKWWMWWLGLVIGVYTAFALAGKDAIAQALDAPLPVALLVLMSVTVTFAGYFAMKTGADVFAGQAHALAVKTRVLWLQVLAVALATALTEFALTAVGLSRGELELVFATITGSDGFNVTVVIGIAILMVEDVVLAFRHMTWPLLFSVAMTLLVAAVGFMGFSPYLAIPVVVCAIGGTIAFMKASSHALPVNDSQEAFRVLRMAFGLVWLLGGSVLFYDGAVSLSQLAHAPLFLTGILSAFAASAPELQLIIPRIRSGEYSLETVLAMAIVSNLLDTLVASAPGAAGMLNAFHPGFASHFQAPMVAVATLFIAITVLIKKEVRVSKWVAMLLFALFITTTIIVSVFHAF